ncbi:MULTISPECIES: hypothetical protein [unclassified Thermosipho (in: thermotogales)]|uniref:hypothetical protein n=1 Tax=unclassified Thermosipho (in: thermotogales) TaxID=2676525 RepID=UPI0009865786|nr:MULTISPECIES: hypothetical protein [unclassified Thermosipho (in: thermotogales)]MBT1247686.1 hypothetical protein [Thermosipho sp. 1244]OOC46735.1 hypothetical protein XO09_04980 [Thermosipho sp. 1223]
MKRNEMLDFVITNLEKLNENEPVLGKDEYFKSEKLEYPEVYAMIVLSYYYLFKKEKDNKWKKKAEKFIDRLISLSIKEDNTICWGLPYDWGVTEKNDGFLITTVFSLRALAKWNSEFSYKYSDVIEKAINWIFGLLYYDENIKENAFYYSPKLKENIYNATSLACGILLESGQYLWKRQKENLISVVMGLIKVQNKKGFWKYSINNPTVDLLHQSYTCEGLLLSASRLKRDLKEKVLKSAIKGVEFMDKYMFNSYIETYFFRLFDNVEFGVKLKHLLFRIFFKKKFRLSRAWSFGAFLRVHTLLEAFGITLPIKLEEILKTIESQLFQNGNFRYNKLDDSVYIRQQAHVWYSLVNYLYFRDMEEHMCL